MRVASPLPINNKGDEQRPHAGWTCVRHGDPLTRNTLRLTNTGSSRTQNSLVFVDGHMRTPFCHFQRRWAQSRCDLDRVGTKVIQGWYKAVQGWYKAIQGWYKVVQTGTRAQRLSEPASGLMQTVQPSRANTTRMTSFVTMA